MAENYRFSSDAPKFKRFIKIASLVIFLIIVNYGAGLLVDKIEFQLWPEHENMMMTMLWLSVAVYVLLMAMPFAPGVELGLALMMMLGPKGVVLVYLCTLFSLSISFAIGKLIPLKSFSRFLGWMYMHKARDLALGMDPLNSEEKLKYLLNAAPARFVPALLEHRYLLIAVALNLPGNSIIGGGGGIGLIAGMSGLFPFPKYILFTSIAITPLPILFLFGNLHW